MKNNNFLQQNLTSRIRGFSLIETLVVVAVIGIISAITLTTFISSRKNEALNKDTDAVVETLQQARNQTISSKNASAYGVNFSSASLVLFAGTSYSSSDPSNQTTTLTPGTTLTTTLPGGTTAIVFNRLTGETNQSGTVTISVVSSPTASTTIKVYRTGTIELVKQ